jgi:hypothetical protein
MSIESYEEVQAEMWKTDIFCSLLLHKSMLIEVSVFPFKFEL